MVLAGEDPPLLENTHYFHILKGFNQWDILLAPHRDFVFPMEKEKLECMRNYVNTLDGKSTEMEIIDDIFSVTNSHFPAMFDKLEGLDSRLSNDVVNVLVTLPMLALVFAPVKGLAAPPRAPPMMVGKTYFLDKNCIGPPNRTLTSGCMFHRNYAPFYNKLEHPLVIPVCITPGDLYTGRLDPRNHFVVLQYHPPKEATHRQNELVVYDSLDLSDILKDAVDENKEHMDAASEVIMGFRKGTLHGGLPPPTRRVAFNTPTQKDARSCGLFCFANTMRACGLWSESRVIDCTFHSRREQFRKYIADFLYVMAYYIGQVVSGKHG